MKLCFCIVVLTAVLAVGQAPVGRIEGRVVSTKGQPIAKATVRVRPKSGQAAVTYSEVTDANGGFALDNIPPGEYFIEPRRSGYEPAFMMPQTVTANSALKVELQVTQNTVISGRVLDQDGDPAAGARVLLLSLNFGGGRRALSDGPAGFTDERGVYRISARPGRYYVLATDQQAFINAGTEHIGERAKANLPTYYPSVVDSRKATLLDGAEGAVVDDVNIRMARSRVYSASGKLVDTGGNPLGATLELETPNGDPAVHVVVPYIPHSPIPDQFQFRLTPGDYVLQVQRGSVRERAGQLLKGSDTGRLEFTVGNKAVEGLILRVGSGPTISGRITVEGGTVADADRPVGGILVGPRPAMAVILRELEGERTSNASARVNPDGTFTFNALGARLYGASLSGTRAYIKSIRFRGQDVTDHLLDLRPGLGGELEVLVSLGGGRIEAVVPQGRGLPPQAVSYVAWPKTPRPTDWNGGVNGGGSSIGARAVTYQGLPPGDYYLAGFELSDPLLQVPEFLARFNGVATAVHVEEGSNHQAEFSLISREVVLRAIEEFR